MARKRANIWLPHAAWEGGKFCVCVNRRNKVSVEENFVLERREWEEGTMTTRRYKKLGKPGLSSEADFYDFGNSEPLDTSFSDNLFKHFVFLKLLVFISRWGYNWIPISGDLSYKTLLHDLLFKNNGKVSSVEDVVAPFDHQIISRYFRSRHQRKIFSTNFHSFRDFSAVKKQRVSAAKECSLKSQHRKRSRLIPVLALKRMVGLNGQFAFDG